MISRTRSRLSVLGGAAAIGIGLALAFGMGGGGQRIASVTSPDLTYRVDWVRADRLDRLLHGNMSAPARVELHENMSGRLVGKSQVVDFDLGGNGQVTWLMKDMGLVSVGPGAQFLHVPPLSPDGHRLPIDKEYDGSTTSSARP
jgi:hypothetical protein